MLVLKKLLKVFIALLIAAVIGFTAIFVLPWALIGLGILLSPNPAKPEIAFNGVVFRRGDKVMQIKNNYDLQFVRDNGETDVGVFNGDIGQIIAVDKFNKSLDI